MRSLFFVSLLALAAGCFGPQEGAPCDADVDGAECVGEDVLLCVCESPNDDGTCPEEGTWRRDELCSCSLNAMTCA